MKNIPYFLPVVYVVVFVLQMRTLRMEGCNTFSQALSCDVKYFPLDNSQLIPQAMMIYGASFVMYWGIWVLRAYVIKYIVSQRA